MKKGKFLSGDKDAVTVRPGSEGALRAPGTSPVVMSEGGGVSALLKTVAWFVAGGLAVLVLLYTALGATLMRATPNWQDGSFVWVKNATFIGGIPENGDFVFADLATPPADNSLLSKVKQTYVGLEYSGVFEVVAGPMGVVTNGADGRLSVDGVPVPQRSTLTQTESVTLKDNYLAICVHGYCETGEKYLLEQNQILGEAQALISSFSVTPFSSPEPPLVPQPEPATPVATNGAGDNNRADSPTPTPVSQDENLTE